MKNKYAKIAITAVAAFLSTTVIVTIITMISNAVFQTLGLSFDVYRIFVMLVQTVVSAISVILMSSLILKKKAKAPLVGFGGSLVKSVIFAFAPIPGFIAIVLNIAAFFGMIFLIDYLEKDKEETPAAGVVNPNFAAQGGNPNFAGQGGNPNFAAQGVNPNFEAMGANPNFAGQGANPNFAGQGANPNFTAAADSAADAIAPATVAEMGAEAPANTVNVQPAAAPAATPVAAQPVTVTNATVDGFIDIPWQQYAPLHAGVSYNPTKNYQFHRAEGFVGSVPQNFVNRTFPKCPVCCSANPYWTISQHNQMSMKGNLYLFKCSQCGGIISMSMPDVTTLGNGGSGVLSNPSVGLTNLLVKSKEGKEAGAVYAVIETVGTSGASRECEGLEFKLEHLQQISFRM